MPTTLSPRRLLVRLLCATSLLATAGAGADADTTAAQPLRVAVAASFAEPLQQLLAGRPGPAPLLSVAASGVLATQIRHGAPFDLFLSADRSRPEALLRDGLAAPGSLQLYAEGTLALWVHPRVLASPSAAAKSPGVSSCADWLSTGSGRLAIANPRLAPYGQAAMATLTALAVLPRWQQQLVRGQSVGQAWQMVRSGAAAAGLVAASQAMAAADGCIWLVPRHLYPALDQVAVIPRRSPRQAQAKALLAWLRSPEVQHQLGQQGYLPIANGATPVAVKVAVAVAVAG